MKNNLATPTETPTNRADDADSKSAEAEVDGAEAWEAQLAKVQGVGKVLCIMFGIGLGVAGLVVLGVLFNTFFFS